ncbi:hypothetical protein H2248_001550 [Termitomyces sp. 'cryptogamus']|nr:hypothetical protein H2248_001550 [Termitomyces sp. 'cryptogamus']
MEWSLKLERLPFLWKPLLAFEAAVMAQHEESTACGGTTESPRYVRIKAVDSNMLKVNHIVRLLIPRANRQPCWPNSEQTLPAKSVLKVPGYIIPDLATTRSTISTSIGSKD